MKMISLAYESGAFLARDTYYKKGTSLIDCVYKSGAYTKSGAHRTMSMKLIYILHKLKFIVSGPTSNE